MRANSEKITREFCIGKELILFPRTLGEAVFIQEQFFRMGFRWGKGSYEFENCSTTVQKTDARLLEGLFLTKNKGLFAGPNSEQLKSSLLCDITQFEEKYLSPQQQMMEQFNKLAVRLEQVASMVDELREELLPKKLDKPIPKRLF